MTTLINEPQLLKTVLATPPDSTLAKVNLLAVRLRLKARHEITLAVDQNRACYWLFLRLLEGIDPELAQELQQPNELRPFTVSNLVCPMGFYSRGQWRITPEQNCYVRVTGLNHKVVQALQQLATVTPTPVMLDDYEFELMEVCGAGEEVEPSVVGSQLSTGFSSYSEIVERHFYSTEQKASLSSVFKFKFHSPTTFKLAAQNQELPLPVPELVFGSLLQRWNAFAPGPLPDDSRLFASLKLRLGRYQTQTRLVSIDGQLHNGFVGVVEFRAISCQERFYLQTLNALADFSFYSGVGYKTTAGLGQVERIASRPRNETHV